MSLVPVEQFIPSVDEARRLAQALRNSRSDNTRKAYRSDWRMFQEWCDERAAVSLPARPELVAVYLTEMAHSGLRASTISRRLTAIAEAHRAAGEPNPAESALVRSAHAGIRRHIGIAVDGKKPLTVKLLASLLPPPDTKAHRRDRALLLVGFAAALRRSELVGLDWSRVDHVVEGLVLTLPRSKTDQQGVGRKVAIPIASDPRRCPVRALQQWSDDYFEENGPIFVGVHRSGRLLGRLSDHAVGKIVKRYVSKAGYDATDFSGHSMRAGFATAAAAGGASERAIMRQTGHKSVVTVRKYIRDGELFRNHPLTETGL